MKLNKIKKIALIVIIFLIGYSVVMLTKNTKKNNFSGALQNQSKNSQPSGTCAPALASCQENAKLCMEKNNATVCN